MDLGLIDVRVTEDLLDGVERAVEEILVEPLKPGTGKGSVEVDALEEGVDLDSGLSRK